LPLSSGLQIDHFKVLRLLGRGGMGEVYLARDTKLGRNVALKLIRADRLRSEGAVEGFLFEARATAKLSHPNIVTIHAVGEHKGRPYVALEYLEGQDLGERLEQRSLSVQQAIRLALPIAEALTEAHRRGILHRDLKPANIVIPRDDRLRIVDFGIAQVLGQTDYSLDTTALSSNRASLIAMQPSGGGTPGYMAPEQWREDACSTAVDVWALGVIIFQMCAGRRPFVADEIADLVVEVCCPMPAPALADHADVPTELDALVSTCLSKDPKARPRAADVAAALRAMLPNAKDGMRAAVDFSALEGIERDDSGTIPRRAEDEPSLSPASTPLPVVLTSSKHSLDSHIRLFEPIGYGGTAVVSRATQLALGREVAVKALRPDMSSPEAARNLMREGFVLGVLEHPNIVPVHMLGKDDQDNPILVLTCVKGKAWRKFVTEGGQLETPESVLEDPLSWNLRVLMQVCNALSYAHSKGILHLDIKPDNVMIGEFGEVYLMDWGIAASLSSEGPGHLPHVSQLRGIAGTPEYMAPEIALGCGSELSERTDVYLAGACLHELVSMRPPHEAASLRESLLLAAESKPQHYGADVPAELAALCHRAMAADPDERYESVQELHDAIAVFLTHRHAARLSQRAGERAEALEELLAWELADKLTVYNLFSECRFGFRQALCDWSENHQALAGLQRATELMVIYELDRGEAEAAATMLAELPEPRPELEARLETLYKQLKRRERELRELEQIGHEANIGLGRRERRRIVLVPCLLLAAVFFGFGTINRLGLLELRWGALLMVHAVCGLALLAGLIYWRNALTQNRANRHFTAVLTMTVLAPTVFSTVAWHLHFAFDFAAVSLLLIYWLVAVNLALTSNTKLLWATVPFGAAFVAAIALPSWSFEIIGACALLAAAALFTISRKVEAAEALRALSE